MNWENIFHDDEEEFKADQEEREVIDKEEVESMSSFSICSICSQIRTALYS